MIRTLELQIGDVVDRWMQDGDIRLFNRQPTLHKQNMNAGRTKIGKQKTIGIPLCNTHSLNADFDKN